MRKKTQKYTQEEILSEFIKTHGDRYDYSKFIYVNGRAKAIIICKKHGEFLQQPYCHMKGQNCRKCMYEGERTQPTKHTVESFITISNIVHNNKYDYSKVLTYKSNKDMVCIICPIHGEFFNRPNNHMRGESCIKCSGTYQYTKEDFIQKSIEQHGVKYDYSLVDYKNNDEKITIICPKHGQFEQVAKDHMRGSGCRDCFESKGEKIIFETLTDYMVNFKRQKTFSDCMNKEANQRLRFDFYIEKYNLIIEYDGEQHFNLVRFRGVTKKQARHNFKQGQLNDSIKNEYCHKNNINLLRIPYTNIDDVEKIILEKINSIAEHSILISQ